MQVGFREMCVSDVICNILKMKNLPVCVFFFFFFLYFCEGIELLKFNLTEQKYFRLNTWWFNAYKFKSRINKIVRCVLDIL